jgi:hypothetical protein
MSTMFLPTRPAWAVAGSGLVLVLALPLPGLRA